MLGEKKLTPWRTIRCTQQIKVAGGRGEMGHKTHIESFSRQSWREGCCWLVVVPLSFCALNPTHPLPLPQVTSCLRVNWSRKVLGGFLNSVQSLQYSFRMDISIPEYVARIFFLQKERLVGKIIWYEHVEYIEIKNLKCFDTSFFPC